MIATNNKNFNILLVGAVGVWSDVNHIPNILELEKKMPQVRVSAVCDSKDPYAERPDRSNLKALLKRDNSVWVEVEDSSLAPVVALNCLHKKEPIDLVVVSCNPTAHFEYALWALKNGIHVVCDKPLLAEPFAASDLNAARKISENYEKLSSMYIQARKKHPNLIFGLVLRRRALTPFRMVADRLELVAKGHNADINHMNILSHSGVYRYPQEMRGRGAHDFTSGIGSLSHSSYHYIDLFHWYLGMASDGIEYVLPRLISVARVKDYLSTEGYASLQNVNGHDSFYARRDIPKEVLEAELDFSFNLGFYDKNDHLVGDANFISNHLSFSPRTRRYIRGEHDPSRYLDGGRISHLYIDIHQSGLQNIQIRKNDHAFGKSNLQVELRAHPRITYLPAQQSLYFEDVYKEVDHSLGDLFEIIVRSALLNEELNNDMIPNILDDEPNNRLFSKFYELLAREYAGDAPITKEDKIKIN